ncbi:hypothetical protein FB548_1891 [Pseudoxanthomonas sp. 3HH-4]|uniref:hypothetical protein n=1 Tax=Pseudoxanthomonas sp. 3HH-4 TaxID=1690214 RepID=UPI001154C78E|nr:hypothetical protein [Pseudoxanthomonas sp. 3HH-4]TQM13037.1 hypothetical protein FB548_1891 [Pseudoxanthomonas sp. 3HH-4]
MLTSGTQRHPFAVRVAVVVLLPVLMVYGGLSLVAFFRPDWLPVKTIWHMGLLGPPALLVWGRHMLVAYGACTVVVVLLLAGCAVVRSDELRLIAAMAAFAVWMGAGFFSALLSV